MVFGVNLGKKNNQNERVGNVKEIRQSSSFLDAFKSELENTPNSGAELTEHIGGLLSDPPNSNNHLRAVKMNVFQKLFQGVADFFQKQGGG